MNNINYFLNKDYPGIIKKYRISPLNKNEMNLLKKDAVLGHWNFAQIFDAIKKREKFAIITGFSASGRLHLGNKIALDIAFYLQKFGGKVFMPLSDTEAELTRKNSGNAVEEFNSFRSDLIKWRFNIGDSEIYLHSSKKDIVRLFNQIVKRLKYQDYKKIYGSGIDLPGIFALSNMLADIFYPFQQGYKKALVILGVDEVRHAKLALLASKRLGFPKPSFLFLKILNGLKKDKMSKSKPEENILLSDTASKVAEKIKKYSKRARATEDDPLYQIALWTLNMNKEYLNKLSKELRYKEFASTISKKLEEQYKVINNGRD